MKRGRSAPCCAAVREIALKSGAGSAMFRCARPAFRACSSAARQPGNLVLEPVGNLGVGVAGIVEPLLRKPGAALGGGQFLVGLAEALLGVVGLACRVEAPAELEVFAAEPDEALCPLCEVEGNSRLLPWVTARRRSRSAGCCRRCGESR